METLVEVNKEEEEQSTTTSNTTVAVVNPSSKKTKKHQLPTPLEIIEEILLRLPVKSILRFTAVSKAWLSLISHPSFPKLQLTHATSAFFLSVFDFFSRKRHYFSAASHGGPLTLLLTVDRDSQSVVCFTTKTFSNYLQPSITPYFVNPSTRKLFKLPVIIRSFRFDISTLLYGYDQSTNQHKILLFNTVTREFMVFDMSSRSWRNIEAEPPVGSTWDDFSEHLDGGVCFDSKVHVMLDSGAAHPFDILVFDFVTEKFSFISIPQDAWPHIWVPGEVGTINNIPFIAKISDSLGVVVYDNGEIHIWLLQDYQNGVWVKETITLPEPWNALAHKFPLSIDANMDDEIVFNITKVSENVVSVPVYNMKSKSFISLEFTLGGQVLSSGTLLFHHIKHYVDSMVPV